MSKKFLVLFTTIIVSISTLLFGCNGFSCKESACSGVKNCAYNLDCAGREIVAGGLEGVACFNDCFSCVSPYACVCGEDNYETVFVACPLACASEARNCDSELSCSSCLIYEDIDTIISSSEYDFDYTVTYDNVETAKSFFKATFEIEVTTNKNWAYVLCSIYVTDSEGNAGEKEIYLGNMSAGKSKKFKATFTFMGKKRDAKLSGITLSGGFTD